MHGDEIAKPKTRMALPRGRDLVAIVALLLALAAGWHACAGQVWRGSAVMDRSQLILLVYAYLLLTIPAMVARRGAQMILGGVAVLALLLLFVADLTALRYFGSSFAELYPHLPVTAQNASLAAIAGTAASYVTAQMWLVGVTGIGAGLIAAWSLSDRSAARVLVLALIPCLFAGVGYASAQAARADPLVARLMAEPLMAEQPLLNRERSVLPLTDGPSSDTPQTVLLVIVESGGADLPTSDGNSLLRDRIIASSGADGWHRFDNAVASGNATDIAVPALLTGTGAQESAEALHSRPLIWQYGQRKGYRTAFVTSSTLDWAGFGPFLAGGKPDRIVSAANSGLPFINDLTVDDHFAYRTAAAMIAQAKGKLFLTLYVNALHVPFQDRSAYPLPPGLSDRRARAAAITKRALAKFSQPCAARSGWMMR